MFFIYWVFGSRFDFYLVDDFELMGWLGDLVTIRHRGPTDKQSIFKL